MHQPLCIDYPNITAGIRELNAITYIKWINKIPQLSPQVFIPQDIYHVFSDLNSIRQDKTSKGKDSIHHNKCGERRNIIWSIYINKARDIEHEREREIKHIATGTYPQPRGWTTPFSSWRAPGWWRWPPVKDPTSGRVPGRAPERFLVAIEPCGGRTSDLG